MADVFTASGATLSIAPAITTNPANAAAWAALTWTAVGMVESLGEFGDSAGTVTGATLGDGRMRKGKSARDAGDFTATVFEDSTDTGQVALIAAEATNNNFPFKVTLPNKLAPAGADGVMYFKGLVTSKRLNVGGNDNLVRRTFTIAINSAITEVAPTAS